MRAITRAATIVDVVRDGAATKGRGGTSRGTRADGRSRIVLLRTRVVRHPAVPADARVAVSVGRARTCSRDEPCDDNGCNVGQAAPSVHTVEYTRRHGGWEGGSTEQGAGCLVCSWSGSTARGERVLPLARACTSPHPTSAPFRRVAFAAGRPPARQREPHGPWARQTSAPTRSETTEICREETEAVTPTASSGAFFPTRADV